MIDPDIFYGPNDVPSDRLRKTMWNAIEQNLRPRHQHDLHFVHRRSFLMGVAATIILIFTSVGVYVTARNAIESSKPETIRLDLTYENAIQQFERFVPATSYAEPDGKNFLTTRKEQLQNLDRAIVALKGEMNGSDVSPMKRTKLRQLYSLKLHVIQDMIEQGEIEL